MFLGTSAAQHASAYSAHARFVRVEVDLSGAWGGHHGGKGRYTQGLVGPLYYSKGTPVHRGRRGLGLLYVPQ